uniref:Uncharacterized protein n=1 Tax=Kalanchoe fedtschenkoi TaxID=63787 RepID=A0A7N0ZZX9_KALFE
MEKPRKIQSSDPSRHGRRRCSYPSSPKFELPIDGQYLADAQMERVRKVESLDQNRDCRRHCSYPSSPEFEFWMVRNPSLPQPNMLTADELFVDGVLLPLDLVPASAPTSELTNPVPVSSVTEPESAASVEVDAGPELTAALEPATGSRRWKDIFKKSESKASKEADQKAESAKTSKKRERKSASGGGHGGSSAAELNINIWPFSRSRSAGTGGARPKAAAGGRKVSSAPCSRSNSGGESKSRKWPASPGRAGVHVGRSSPVWQVRRAGSAAIPRPSTTSEAAEGRKNGIPSGGKTKIISKDCNCKHGAAPFAAANSGDLSLRGCSRKGAGGSNDGSGVVNLFNLRSLFSKKVY